MTKRLVFFFLLFSLSALAAPQFDPVRDDNNIPAHCEHFEIQDFSIPHHLIVYGIRGAIKEGFTHEFPIERHEARLLWDALSERRSGDMSEIRSSKRLYDLYKMLHTQGREMGFDYMNEGDVLEGLALIDLVKEYPSHTYFRTGGLAYGHSGSNGVMGELDVLVGRKSDCKIVIVGEAKLGLHRLGYAYSQLQRFENFLSSYLDFTKIANH